MKISDWIIDPKIAIPENSEILELPKFISKNVYLEFFKKYQNCFSQKVYMLNFSNVKVGSWHDGISGPAVVLSDGVILEDLVSYPGDGAQGLSMPMKVMDGKGICMAQKWGGHNYGHWLFTSVPKLALCIKEGIEFDYIVHNSCHLPCVQQSFKLAGIKQEVIELRLFPHLFCKNLTMPSFIGNFVSPNRTAVSLIRWLFLKYLCPSEGKKIYLKRTNYRTITNENEVWEILSRKGFKLVQPEKLTFLEQIQLFSKCDVVIGNGSGLSNTVFCNKGTKVLNFDSPTWLDIFHWYHAEANDLDYYQMTGIPFNPTAVIDPQTDGCKSFTINIDELKEMLNIMEI